MEVSSFSSAWLDGTHTNRIRQIGGRTSGEAAWRLPVILYFVTVLGDVFVDPNVNLHFFGVRIDSTFTAYITYVNDLDVYDLAAVGRSERQGVAKAIAKRRNGHVKVN